MILKLSKGVSFPESDGMVSSTPLQSQINAERAHFYSYRIRETHCAIRSGELNQTKPVKR